MASLHSQEAGSRREISANDSSVHCYREQLESILEKKKHNDAEREARLHKALDVQQAKRWVMAVLHAAVHSSTCSCCRGCILSIGPSAGFFASSHQQVQNRHLMSENKP